MAGVIPIFQKGSQTSLNNYSPISLLFNKLLEKLMYIKQIRDKLFIVNSFDFPLTSQLNMQILVLLTKSN